MVIVLYIIMPRRFYVGLHVTLTQRTRHWQWTQPLQIFRSHRNELDSADDRYLPASRLLLVVYIDNGPVQFRSTAQIIETHAVIRLDLSRFSTFLFVAGLETCQTI